MGLSGKQLMVLIGGALFMASQSCFNIFGVIVPYQASVIHNQSNQSLIGYGLLLAITLGVVGQHIGGLLSGSWQSLRLVGLVSVLGVSGCMYILAYASTLAAYILIYFFFGMFGGFGLGVPIQVAYQHLPYRKKLCCYVILTGVPVGAFVLIMANMFMINPHNIPLEGGFYPAQVTDSVRGSFKTTAIACFIAGIIGVGLLSPKDSPKKPEEKDSATGPLIQLPVIGGPAGIASERNEGDAFERVAEVPGGDVGEVTLPAAPAFSAPYSARKWYKDKQDEKQVVHHLTMGKMSGEVFSFLKKKQFHLLMAIQGISTSFISFILFNWKGFAFDALANNDHLVTYLISAGVISLGLSRYIWGPLYHKYSFPTLSAALNIILLIVCVGMSWFMTFSIGNLFVLVCVFGCLAGNAVLIYPQAVEILGPVLASKVGSWLSLGVVIGTVVQFFISVLLVYPYGRDGYMYGSIGYGGLLIVAIFYSLTTDFPIYTVTMPSAEPANEAKEANPHKEL